MRSLSDIYNETVTTRNKYLALSDLTNDSKMSVINAISWTVSSVVYSFESLLDAFMLDIAKAFSNRINGTPAYYANALLKFQYGDDLVINDEGTSFQYSNIDESKRIITNVSYEETYMQRYLDDVLLLKCAKGPKTKIEKLSDDELAAAKAYIQKIKFAGVKTMVISRKGDIVIPKVTVYYDGAISLSDLYDAIDASLFNYFSNMGFDSTLYAQKVIDAIQAVEHVTDVYIDETNSQGIYIAQYDDDDNLSVPSRVKRVTSLASGYARQSSKTGAELNVPTFREAMVVLLENSTSTSV